MTNAAVVDPASTSATQAANGNGATQAPPAPAGAGTDPNARAVQTEQAPAPAAKAGGQQPAAGEVTQPPATPAAPAAPTLTREEWEAQNKADTEAKERAEKLKAFQEDLKAFNRTAPITARDAMTSLEKSLRAQYGPDVDITDEMRKPFLDLIDTALLKAREGAKLELGEDNSAEQELEQVSTAYYDTFETFEDKKLFSDAVAGKPNEAWPAVFAEVHQDIGRVNTLGELVEVGSELLGESARASFAAAAKTAEDLEGLVKALVSAAQAEGRGMPPAEPRIGGAVAGAAGAAEPRNMREVRKAHSTRQITTAQLRDYQARNSRGQFPD